MPNTMKFIVFAAALMMASRLTAGQPVELVGYMSNGDERLFILYDVNAKESSLWIKLGQAWHGYRAESFDAKKEDLTVRNGASDYVLGLRASKVHGIKSIVLLARGSYKLVDDTMVYSPDAKLRLRNNLISSPNGVMVSDNEQTIVAGDLLIEKADGRMLKVTNAVVTSKDGGTVITGDSMEIAAPEGGGMKAAGHVVVVEPPPATKVP
jgi:hypothetical protein